MIHGLFVTGTDTGVGKTVLCAALLQRYRGTVPLRYWKPIQTGIELDDDTAEVRRLGEVPDAGIFDQGLRLEKPVSPHLAAKWAGETINLHRVRQLLPSGEEARWIVEGAGGILTPLNDVSSMADFIAMLGLPVLIAARTGLGTINHTLLTLEALRSRSLVVAGVVMIGDLNADNAAAIEHYGRVPVVGQMPRLDPLTPESLRAWTAANFDTNKALGKLLL